MPEQQGPPINMIKGWCTICGTTVYAVTYERDVINKPDLSIALSQDELANPSPPTYHKEQFSRFSLEPYGPTILACPHCGTFF